MTSERRATVIVPTTGDRGPSLEIAVASVLRQTVTDIEVFIVGDGVDDVTRRVARALCDADDRVRFVDHPKHVRRGEPYRHEILTQQARGRIVAYLCDRDLWFSDHLAELERCLADHDLATTCMFDDLGRAPVHIRWQVDVTTMLRSERVRRHNFWGALSAVGHTLEAYQRLPDGWQETPLGIPTDQYMFRQFFDQPWLRAKASGLPTVVWLKRGEHPGLSTPRRHELLVEWNERLTTSPGEATIRADVLDELWNRWQQLESRRLDQRILQPMKRSIAALLRPFRR